MVARPGVLFLGGYGIQGGQNHFAGSVNVLNYTDLQFLGDKEIMRVVPDDPATGATTTEVKPWFGPGGTEHLSVSSSTTSLTVSGTPWTGLDLTGQTVLVLWPLDIPTSFAIGIRGQAVVTSNTDDTINFATMGFDPGDGVTSPGVVAFTVGNGIFRSYHAARGFLNAVNETGVPQFRPGSAWNASGQGIGPDITAMREFWEGPFSAAPYFYATKWATLNNVFQDYANTPNDSARAGLLAHLQTVEAAALAEGDTIDWELCYTNYVQEDITAALVDPVGYALYVTRAQEFMTWLRSAGVCNNVSMRVLFQSPDPKILETTSAGVGALLMRSYVRQLSRDDDNVGLVDMRGQPLGTCNRGVPGHTLPAADSDQYSMEGVLYEGREIARAYERLLLPTPSDPSGAFPIYILFGDSIITGEIPITWVRGSNSEELAGPWTGDPNVTVRPSNQKQWNGLTVQFEVYDPSTNANTLQSTPSVSGPELAIHAELGKKHPDGYGVLKLGSSGSGLASTAGPYSGALGEQGSGGIWLPAAGENYAILQEQYALVQQYVNNTFGQQADLRAIFASLGHNDHVSFAQDAGALFANNLEPFLLQMWEDFATRTSGKDFPIIWRRPQKDVPNVNVTTMQQVRSAIEQMDKKYSQFKFTDVDGLERDRDDELHETPESAVTGGRRMVTALNSIAF